MKYQWHEHRDYEKMTLRELIVALEDAINQNYATWDCNCGSPPEREAEQFFPEMISMVKAEIEVRMKYIEGEGYTV